MSMDNNELDFGGILSSIIIDGVKVPQYGIEHDEDAQSATSWIVSKENKHFAIQCGLTLPHWRGNLDAETYVIRIRLDGHIVFSILMSPEDETTPVFKLSSIPISDTQPRGIMFGSLPSSDDDALLEYMPTAKALGEIEITLHKAGSIIQTRDTVYSAPPQVANLHERANKGLSHGVKYGKIREKVKSSVQSCRFPNSTLVYTHIIRYRPLEILQANGIVIYIPERGTTSDKLPSLPPSVSVSNPRKRSAQDRELKSESVSSDDEDEERIAEERKALMVRLATLERLEATRKMAKHIRKKVKRESVKEESVKYFRPGEIIDLTI